MKGSVLAIISCHNAITQQNDSKIEGSQPQGMIKIAVCADVKEVLLSDGNEKAIENVRVVIEKNRRAGLFTCTDVSSRVVRWDSEGDMSSMEGRFDVVMCADCCSPIIAVIWRVIPRRLMNIAAAAITCEKVKSRTSSSINCNLSGRRPGAQHLTLSPRGRGTALVFAPTRGDTLTEFCNLAEGAGLLVCRYDNYDSIVWDLHMKLKREGKETYDENIHYPVLLTLTHISSPHLL
ncbi:Calmodulin-lysine N-methyltransferase [Bagarius yarrelli]|uniref:Calmodulin-lysine N-methyltransferase n=1 Tax=Bagarius yarrelli TaxID=175774 RepID=A0A556TRC2_BAGYA|nr:Calmodulin-lysine N-methyltransferase [Bagarius yarrelli]